MFLKVCLMALPFKKKLVILSSLASSTVAITSLTSIESHKNDQVPYVRIIIELAKLLTIYLCFVLQICLLYQSAMG